MSDGGGGIPTGEKGQTLTYIEVTGGDKGWKAVSNLFNDGKNIGIGSGFTDTTGPTELLHINGTGVAPSAVLLLEDADTNENPELRLKYGASDTDRWSVFVNKESGNSENSFNIWGTGTDGQTALTILPNGNVGIGVSDPATRLQIDDPIAAYLGFRATRQEAPVLFSIGARSDSNETDGADRAEIFVQTKHDLAFFTDGALRSSITKDGNFQIGLPDYSTIPAQLLVHKEPIAGVGKIVGEALGAPANTSIPKDPVASSSENGGINPPQAGGSVGTGNAEQFGIMNQGFSSGGVAPPGQFGGSAGLARGASHPSHQRYIGCFKDDPLGRALPTKLMNSGATIESCVSTAMTATRGNGKTGFAYVGLQYGGECFAGDSVRYQEDPAGCTMRCTADTSRICGGWWRNSIYATGVAVSQSQKTTELSFLQATQNFVANLWNTVTGKPSIQALADTTSGASTKVLKTINGEGTAFSDLSVGDYLYVAQTKGLYLIAEVKNDTQLLAYQIAGTVATPGLQDFVPISGKQNFLVFKNGNVLRVERGITNEKGETVPDLVVDNRGIVSIGGNPPAIDGSDAKLYVNGNVRSAEGYCLGATCVTNWDDIGIWAKKGNDIYSKNTGKVGIGITTPSYPLHISNSVEFPLAYIRTGSSDTWGIGADDNGTYFKDITSGNIPIYMTEGGYVGIGTTGPDAKLEINDPVGSGSAFSPYFRVNTGTNLGSTATTEQVLGSFWTRVADGNDFGLGIRAYRTATGTGWSNAALILGYDVDNTARAGAYMSLHANGNVGIGTISPTNAKLEVQNAGGVHARFAYDADRYIDVTGNGGVRLRSKDDQNNPFEITKEGLGDIIFKTGNNGATQARMVIKQNGAVGIGISEPISQFDVRQQGSVGSQGRTVGVMSNLDGTFKGLMFFDSSGKILEKISDFIAPGDRLRIGTALVGVREIQIVPFDGRNVQIAISTPVQTPPGKNVFTIPGTSVQIPISTPVRIPPGKNAFTIQRTIARFSSEGSLRQVVVDGDGNVGVGVSAPVYPLHVAGKAAFGYVVVGGAQNGVGESSSNMIDLGGGDTSREVNAGKISYKHFGGKDALDIIGAGKTIDDRKINFLAGSAMFWTIKDSEDIAPQPMVKLTAEGGTAALDIGSGLLYWRMAYVNDPTGVNSGRLRIQPLVNDGKIKMDPINAGITILRNGNVGINNQDPKAKLDILNGGIDVHGGDVKVSYLGDKLASEKHRLALAKDRIGLDVAELYETEEDVEIGDVLVAGSKDRKLKKSSEQYESDIIGIVSGAPALLFEGSELKLGSKPERFTKGMKPPVALAGRVPVKVSLENGVIKIGDYLTSSSKRGLAMRASEPGMALGIALENYSGGGDGMVLTFVNVGEKNASQSIEKLEKQVKDLKKQIQKIR